MTYKAAILKRNIEAILMSPFVGLGWLCAGFFRLKTNHRVFIFAPSADIGGSVKVNIDLCQCLADLSPLVIFSKRPKNNQFLSLFEATGARTIALHPYVDHKLYHFVNFFYRGVVASWIKRSDRPLVIGGESLFFYKVLPHINRFAFTADVCHLNTWYNYTQAFVKDIDARIFSSPQLKRDAEALYRNNRLPDYLYQRLHFIDNKVDIPDFSPKFNDTLQVVFVGRGAPQKRVPLIAAIARSLHEKGVSIHFSFVGDVEKVIDPGQLPYCTFYGNVGDKDQLQEIYKQSDILLLTSAYEGLPIAVMEMMAFGKVIVSTAVGGIPDYIENGERGFLIENYSDEARIITEAIDLLLHLQERRDLLEKMGANCRTYAEAHFSGKVFCSSYRKVLLDASAEK
ncbi:MAG: glycosyltransferase family 4 protein [Bacteroidota bacterium]|nr:glycosyltransferase family 4 protein [Bacteroidota bacterium]